jgi:thioesterase domain-containing protein
MSTTDVSAFPIERDRHAHQRTSEINVASSFRAEATQSDNQGINAMQKSVELNGQNPADLLRDRSLAGIEAAASKAVIEAGQGFNEYLWSEIPICEHMQIRALPFSRERFVLLAPLAPNRNVHGTAFAGSLYTVMSMAGWGLIRVELDRQLGHATGKRADLWLTKASIRYADPVTDGFAAVAETDQRSLDQFWQKLLRKGRGKMRLNTIIGDPKSPLVTVQGEYAAKLIDNND